MTSSMSDETWTLDVRERLSRLERWMERLDAGRLLSEARCLSVVRHAARLHLPLTGADAHALELECQRLEAALESSAEIRIQELAAIREEHRQGIAALHALLVEKGP